MNSVIPDLSKLVAEYQSGYSLPADFYREQFVYQNDLEKIFYRRWIYAGHISQIAQPGQYFTVDFAEESVIVTRDKTDQVRAFINVCRHRGSRVCLEASGKVSTFVCPYHAWTYGLDGQLRSRRHMPDDFKREDFGLKPTGVSVFQGLIFINLDPNAPDLNTAFKPMESAFSIYQLENTRVAHQATFSVDANWKLAIENFMECYHCAPAHAEYSCSHALNSPEDYERLRPAMLEQSQRLGFELTSVDCSNPDGLDSVQYFYNRSALYEGYVTGSKSGDVVAPLLGQIKQPGGGAADVQMGPATYAILYPDHAVLYRFLPTGVQTTDMEIVWLVEQNAVKDKDYRLDDLTWLWTVTTEADKKIILNNQKGVNSNFYQPGPLAQTESFVTNFIQWYLKQIVEE